MEHPTASVEAIAAIVFPNAASIMSSTTRTIAIASFAMSICMNISSVKLFMIFIGLLVIADFISKVLLLFPALCIYDNNRSKGEGYHEHASPSSSINGPSPTSLPDQEQAGEADDKIDHILLKYYNFLHMNRYLLLKLCFGALVLSVYFASSLKLPTTSDVRLLNPSNQYEQDHMDRQHLLSTILEEKVENEASVVWGITPADTGNYSKCFLSSCYR